jgi:hypothetical protein
LEVREILVALFFFRRRIAHKNTIKEEGESEGKFGSVLFLRWSKKFPTREMMPWSSLGDCSFVWVQQCLP